jgi:hypothetical protein
MGKGWQSGLIIPPTALFQLSSHFLHVAPPDGVTARQKRPRGSELGQGGTAPTGSRQVHS